MTRLPRPGHVKSRLALDVGEARACEIHRELSEHAVHRMRAAATSLSASFEVHFEGGSRREARAWLGQGLELQPQRGEDLAQRLLNAFLNAFSQGAGIAIAVGSDCPDLGGVHVRTASRLLRNQPVVLGPACDGGYYLVGVRADAAASALPALFSDRIPWGTDGVLQATVNRLGQARMAEPALLEELADVDRPEDLPHWEQMVATDLAAAQAPRVSVVIPTFNESASIDAAIASAWAGGADEVIVADGGSIDDTVERALSARVDAVTGARGRAAQMNAGAYAANGDALCFLHADTELPLGASHAIRDTLADPAVFGGAFGFSAGDSTCFTDRMISHVGMLRYRVFGLPYGDQAIFVRRRDFEDLGGFPEQIVMEDYEFALRLKSLGPLGRAPGDVRTSARAWHENGLVRCTVANMAVIAGYRAGIAPDTLARWRKRASARA